MYHAAQRAADGGGEVGALMNDGEALALFLEEMGVALRRWGARMRASSAAMATTPEVMRAKTPTLERLRGKNQRSIVALPGVHAEEGARTAEIAEASGIGDVANTWNTLQALTRNGYVELVPESNPQRWRLRSAYRSLG